jgi:hypothetical protein
MSDAQLDLFGNPPAIDVGVPPVAPPATCPAPAGTLLEYMSQESFEQTARALITASTPAVSRTRTPTDQRPSQ